ESEDGDRCVLRSASNSVSDVEFAWVDLVWCGCWSWCWCSCCRSVLLVFSNKGFVKSFALEVTLFLELLSKCDLLLDFSFELWVWLCADQLNAVHEEVRGSTSANFGAELKVFLDDLLAFTGI